MNQQARADFLDAFLERYFNSLSWTIYLGCKTERDYEYPLSVKSKSYSSWTECIYPPNAFYLQLAPVQELFILYQDGHSFAHNTIVVYGSFNIRSALNRSNDTTIAYETMFSQFERVLFYESVPASSPTQFHGISFDQPEIDLVIRWWNAIVYQHCSKNLHQPRCRAIAESIQTDPMQFVNADTGLVATLLMDPATLPHLVTGILDLPKSSKSGFRMYTKIRGIAPAADSKFLTLYSTDETIKIEHGKKIRALLME